MGQYDTFHIVSVNMFRIATSHSLPSMTAPQSPGERLQTARIEAGYAEAADAARAMGVNVITYRAHENDQNGYWKNLSQYSRFFRVSADWLVTGRMPKRPREQSVDIVGHVGAAAEVHGLDCDRSTSRIDSLPGIDPASVWALEVRGTSQWPRYVEGELVLVDREPCSPQQAHGRYAVAICEDGRHLLKRIYAERDGAVALESHNAPPETGVAVRALHLVRGTMLR